MCGSGRLNLGKKAASIQDKQAAAAVGQSMLMREYAKAFGEHEITVAQILLTQDEITDRERYINTRNAMARLLDLGVIPVVNENDTVSVEEIRIGDNDTLSALVASLIGADLLMMLTDVDGFMMPDEDTELQVIEEIPEITKRSKRPRDSPSNEMGTGGMVTKLQAAKICMDAGVTAVIASGRKDDVISQITAGKKIGTHSPPKRDHGVEEEMARARAQDKGDHRGGRRRRDGSHKGQQESSTCRRIANVEGSFDAGDSVSIKNDAGIEIARGLTNYSSDKIAKFKGMSSAGAKKEFGESINEVIHRDNLVLMTKELTSEQ